VGPSLSRSSRRQGPSLNERKGLLRRPFSFVHRPAKVSALGWGVVLFDELWRGQ
jgi:hypothetical protein